MRLRPRRDRRHDRGADLQHLRVLRAERTVRNRRDGRMVYYSLDDAHVRLLMDLALQHVSH